MNGSAAAAARKLCILGAVGNCLDILDAALAINERCGGRAFEICGFLDDSPDLAGATVRGLPVLGPLAAAREMSEVLFVNGIGSSASYRGKADMAARLGLPAERYATVVHPLAAVSPSARLGRGTVILSHCSICADVTVGDHVMMLPSCVLGHDTRVGDYVTFAAGVTVSGRVTIGESAYLGTGSCIRNGVGLGERSLLGMGAVLVRDAPADVTLAGNPARIVQRQDGEA